MLKNFRLALLSLWRECRAGEWLIVVFALFFAVSATTTLHFYTDRLKKALEQQSSKLLGGDLAISSGAPLPQSWKLKAENLHLRAAEIWIYPSMANAKDKMQLINLEAVSEQYPASAEKPARPEPHTAWADPSLFEYMDLKLKDTVSVGAGNFILSQITSPDSDLLSNTTWMMAPRLIMRLEEVASTQTVVPGSRIDYRLLLSGEKSALNQFAHWLLPQLKPGQRLLQAKRQQALLKNVLERSENYFQLTLLTCLIMSGLVIAISMQQYLRRHYAQIALWRCLGALQENIRQVYLYKLLLIALIIGSLGVFSGFILQELIAGLFKDFLRLPLPPPSLAPAFLGWLTSFLLLFSFSYPLIIDLPRHPPLALWRKEVKINNAASNLYFVSSLSLLLIFIYILLGSSLLTLFMIDALLLSIGSLYALSIGLLYFLTLVREHTEGALRQGLNQLIRHPESVAIQLSTFTLILTLLMVLAMTGKNIIDEWQQALPPKTPNYFAMNIAPNDIIGLEQTLKGRVENKTIYPITRGRLLTLNQKPILEALPPQSRGHNALHRELNLSWMWEFPADNKIISGTPWTKADEGKPLISIEKALARDLQLTLGDELGFQIGDKQITARIVSIREVNWTSFHPNFYVIFVPGLLRSFPTTYLSSFHLNADQKPALVSLIQQFPNLTLIDITTLLKQIQGLIAKLAFALEGLFLFTLGTGILIFLLSLQGSMDERRQTYKILRILGAGKNYIRKMIISEFACLFFLIILASVLLAKSLTYLLMKNLL